MSVFKRNKNWYIKFRDSHGVYRTYKIGPSRKVAYEVYNKIMLDEKKKKFGLPVYTRIKFADFSKIYLDKHSYQKKSYKRDIGIVKNLLRYFANFYLDQINTYHVEDYRKERLNKVKPATVNREVTCLKAILNKAVEWGYLENNPIRKIKMLKERNYEWKFLEIEELRRLIKNCNGYLKPIVMLASLCGLRKGEILNLKWNHIDFQNNVIMLFNTKNNKPRVIPMSKIVKNELMKIPKDKNSPYIFLNKNKKPLGNVRKSFATALRKSGIKNFRFHDLRHTFCSLLVKAGIDLRTVAELMGHSSLDMVMRYAHLSPNLKQRAINYLAMQIENNENMEYVEQKFTAKK